MTAGGYTAFTYSPPADLVDAGSSGRLRPTSPATARTSTASSSTLTKRLSNKWMGRVAFSTTLFKQDYDGVIPVRRRLARTAEAGRQATHGNPTRPTATR